MAEKSFNNGRRNGRRPPTGRVPKWSGMGAGGHFSSHSRPFSVLGLFRHFVAGQLSRETTDKRHKTSDFVTSHRKWL